MGCKLCTAVIVGVYSAYRQSLTRPQSVVHSRWPAELHPAKACYVTGCCFGSLADLVVVPTGLCCLQITVHKAINDVYAASVDKKIAVKVGSGNWSPQDDGLQVGQKDWKLATSGANFAVWEAVY